MKIVGIVLSGSVGTQRLWSKIWVVCKSKVNLIAGGLIAGNSTSQSLVIKGSLFYYGKISTANKQKVHFWGLAQIMIRNKRGGGVQKSTQNSIQLFCTHTTHPHAHAVYITFMSNIYLL